jgi:O-antigen ligase
MLDNVMTVLNYLFAVAMPFSHVGGYVVVGAGLLFSFSYWSRIKREPLFYAILAFMAYGFIRAFFSSAPAIGFNSMIGYACQWLLPFLLGLGLNRTGEHRKIFWTFFSVFLAIICFSILAYFGLFFKSLGPGIYLADEGLLKGLRSHIALAAMCLVLSFFALAQLTTNDRLAPGKKRLLVAVLVLLNAALFLTGSRSYYAAAAVSYFFFGIAWLFRTRRWGLFAGMIAGCCFLAATLYFSVPAIRQRISGTTIQTNSAVERLSLYKVALWEFKDSPIWGFGPGQGIKQTKYFQRLPGEMQNVNRHPALHDFYLNFAADFGAFGLLIFVLALYLIMKRLWIISKNGDVQLASLGLGLFWGLTGILIGDCFDTLLRGPGTAMELFWLTGLLFSYERNIK